MPQTCKLLNPQVAYKQALAQYLQADPQQITLYWKARVGLYGILQALGIGPGDEVILPAFTCVVVPNAILYLGALPIYVDIEPATYNIDLNSIEKHISPRTKAILVQNTFGCSPDFKPIKALADQYGLLILEDNTHGFGSTYDGQPAGTLGDAAFYSTQWNKPFSTGLGGFVLANSEPLVSRMQDFERTLPPPSANTERMLKAQLYLRARLGFSSLYWTAQDGYRWLSKHNWIKGSSSGEEIQGTAQPPDFLLAHTATQAKEGLRQLAVFDQNLAHRQTLAKNYDRFLIDRGLAPVFQPTHGKHIFLKYPILVKNRTRFLQLAKENHIPLGDWFISPLHPVQNNLEQWHFQSADFPVATKVSQHILNLPTDPAISPALQTRILDFLDQHLQEMTLYERF